MERRETPSEYGSQAAQRLYEAAKGYLGQDLTPGDKIPDTVACVAQFQELHTRVFGRHVGSGAALYNCRYLRDALRIDPDFEAIAWEDVKPGDVVVFASGESPIIKHGHVFIVGKVNWMSNNSETGEWDAHKIKTNVIDYYMRYARFTPHVFRHR